MADTQTPLYPIFDNVILWRHAQAEQADLELGEQDNARQLTHKGHNQAKCMARWLKQHLPENTLLLSSPAVRAVQTAEALPHKIQLNNALKPGANLTDVLNALTQYQQQKNILIVGHQPWLGELVAYLLAQATFDVADIQSPNVQSPMVQSVGIKKGAVWWLRRHSLEASQPACYKLHTLQTPSLL